MPSSDVLAQLPEGNMFRVEQFIFEANPELSEGIELSPDLNPGHYLLTREDAIRLLDRECVFISSIPDGEFDGISFLKISVKGLNIIYHEKNWFGYFKRVWLEEILREIFSPDFGKEIHVVSQDDSAISPNVDPNKFFIHSGASPNERKSDSDMITAPRVLFGYGLSTRAMNRIAIWHDGYPLFEQTSGYIIAGMDELNLFIYHTALYGDSSNDKEIFRRICLMMKKILDEGFTNVDFSNIYVACCHSRVDVQLASLSSERITLRNRIDNHKLNITRDLIHLGEVKAQIDMFGKAWKSDDTRFREEYQRIVAHPNVNKVRITPNIVTIITDMMYATDERTGILYELGKYRVCVRLDSGLVTYHNLTRSIRGYSDRMMGPHIYEDGRACFGNIEGLMAQLAATLDIEALVKIAIDFISAVDITDPAGSYISHWPPAPVEMQPNEDTAKAAADIRKTKWHMANDPVGVTAVEAGERYEGEEVGVNNIPANRVMPTA